MKESEKKHGSELRGRGSEDKEDKELDLIRPENVFESLNCAIEGVIYAVKHQRHIRYFFAIAAAALLLSLTLNLPAIEFVLFSIAIVILLFAELVNTAIETTIDIVCGKRYHALARVAKDVSAGAVLISSIGVFIMSYVIFSKYLIDPISGGLRTGKAFAGHVAVVALLIVLIAVVASKAYFGKGSPLHGGMPSGHSAVAFSLWASVVLLTLNPIVTLLTFIMALMVSHSRLIGGVHTKFEVFLGALLGIGITSLIFYIFSVISK
ncbi:MAG: diacylglycerol kinase [Deltaproteobacteria bacterium]|nr:diacylglycerol kinase [Deltaproteobacteria bacterium]